MLNLNTLTPLVAHGSLVLLAWPLTFVVVAGFLNALPSIELFAALSRGRSCVCVADQAFGWNAWLLVGMVLCDGERRLCAHADRVFDWAGRHLHSWIQHSVIPADGTAVEMASFGLLRC